MAAETAETEQSKERPFEGAAIMTARRLRGGCAFSDETRLADPLARALIAAAPMRRLADIGFLGAIDHARPESGPRGRRHDRLEHSIAVAELADVFARVANLPERRRQTLLAAALLHDVGHGPLSHTLEPTFRAEFGIDHHGMTRRVILGDSAWALEISDLLAQADIDAGEVLAIIDGTHDGDIGFLLSGPINLDTIEGITRCRAFAGPPGGPSPFSIARDWASSPVPPRAKFDAFWQLKHEIYNSLICARRYAAFDAVAEAFMAANLSRFSPEDFSLTTREFRARHPDLFRHLDGMAEHGAERYGEMPRSWMKREVALQNRSFFVSADVELDGNASLRERYLQLKTVSIMTLEELLYDAP